MESANRGWLTGVFEEAQYRLISGGAEFAIYLQKRREKWNLNG